jgi:hypothetical protein
MKRAKRHRVPLSQQAIAILRTQEAERGENPFVFPAGRSGPLSNMLMAMFAAQDGCPGDGAWLSLIRPDMRCRSNWLRQLLPQLDAEGVRIPIRIDGGGRSTGGGLFSRGHVYKLLSNPIRWSDRS